MLLKRQSENFFLVQSSFGGVQDKTGFNSMPTHRVLDQSEIIEVLPDIGEEIIINMNK